jgi:hypothetical protein
MTVDIDKLPLVVLPANHLIFKEKKDVLEIANINQKLKQIILTVSIAVVGLIIANQIIKKQNERRKEN